ncbi:unnamed protein product, partial [Candidula unifasciata]
PVLLQNVDFCYENADSTMKIEIDEKLLNKIIWDHCVQNGQVYTGHRTMPVSHIDESIMLTAEDRLAVYNYVVKKSHEEGKVIPVDRTDELLTTDWGSLVKKGLLDAQNNKQFASKLEQLAALRDLRRRRQSYRAKNVHITKKTYTEIIREVISNQMEILVPADSSEEMPVANEDDSRSEPGHYNTDRDSQKEHRLDHREIKKEHRDDSDRWRAKDRERKGSEERYRRGEKSEDRYSSRTRRDTNYSRDRGFDKDRYKVKEEEGDSQHGNDRPRRFTEAGDSQHGNDKPRRFTEAGDSQPSERISMTETSGSQPSERIRILQTSDSLPSAERPRRFTEADELRLEEILKEIKTEPVDSNDSSFVSTSAYLPSNEMPPQEQINECDVASEKSYLSRKRSHSDSDSSSNSSRRHGKHKKSKHKKKHSKKHKRR